MIRLAIALALFSGCARLDSFLYAVKPAPPEGIELPTTVIPTFERFRVITSDGESLDTVYVRGTRADTIFYCHGNNTHLGTAWARIELLYPLGYNLVVFDYRGYGTSTGKPTEAGLMEDVRAVRAAILGKPGVDPARIIYYGRSLGCAVCIDLATAAAPRALISESPFASVRALVQDGVYADFAPSFIIDSEWDNLAKIPTIAAPYLSMHGLADDFVQPKYSIELTAAHRGPKQLVLVEGADHGDVPDKMGTDPYLRTVDRFIQDALR
jgi:hypothetical protein